MGGLTGRYIPYLLVNTYVCRSTAALPLSRCFDFSAVFDWGVGECMPCAGWMTLKGLYLHVGKALTTVRVVVIPQWRDDATFLFGLDYLVLRPPFDFSFRHDATIRLKGS